MRDALSDAIKVVKASSILEEPTEADRRSQLHIDHDTKVRTGWVDITQPIFEKIESSAVFVVDVTPVAASPSKKDEDGKEIGERPIMNPNVAIELGYALKALDWPKIIPVMNTAYGTVERMPFDIDRTRRWALTYNLKEGASNAEIKEARSKLSSAFVSALKGYVSTAAIPVRFAGAEPQIPPGLFFEDGETLAYLKIIPLRKAKSFTLSYRPDLIPF